MQYWKKLYWCKFILISVPESHKAEHHVNYLFQDSLWKLKTAFSLSYLNELFIAQIFYLIYNICEWKLWKQAMRPVLVTLHQKLEITCLRKRKLIETSSQLKLHAILRCENWLAISFLDNSFITTFTNKYDTWLMLLSFLPRVLCLWTWCHHKYAAEQEFHDHYTTYNV